MDHRLKDHLVATGKITSDGLSRRARGWQCKKCRAYTMRGLDDEILAGEAVVDSRPLNARGELQALLEGRTTYDLTWRGGRYVIDRRGSWEIRDYPPGDRVGVDVVQEHRCGTRATETTASLIQRPVVTKTTSDEPPF